MTVLFGRVTYGKGQDSRPRFIPAFHFRRSVGLAGAALIQLPHELAPEGRHDGRRILLLVPCQCAAGYFVAQGWLQEERIERERQRISAFLCTYPTGNAILYDFRERSAGKTN